MSDEIKNLAEGAAFMDAVDDILGLNHPLRDVEIARLRRAWIAGRDYTLAAGSGDWAGAERKALAEIRACLDHLYSERNGAGLSMLPAALAPYAGPIGVIDRVVTAALSAPRRDDSGDPL